METGCSQFICCCDYRGRFTAAADKRNDIAAANIQFFRKRTFTPIAEAADVGHRFMRVGIPYIQEYGHAYLFYCDRISGQSNMNPSEQVPYKRDRTDPHHFLLPDSSGDTRK